VNATHKSCSRCLDFLCRLQNQEEGKQKKIKMGNAQSPPSHKDPRFASASRFSLSLSHTHTHTQNELDWFRTDCRAFTHTELEDLKSLIVSLAAQSQSDGEFISPSVFQVILLHSLPCFSLSFHKFPFFCEHGGSCLISSSFTPSQAHFGLHGPLGDRMFDLVTQQRKDQKLTFEDLVVAKVISVEPTCDSWWLFGIS
jgi:hypothetical protein